MVSTTSFLNSGVYRLFGTPFGIKITPPVKHYIILSNKWGAVHCYHRAFFYVMGIAPETRSNIRQMFDFKQDCIEPDGMHGGWQTSGTVRVCRLAFNLWNGYTDPEHSNAYSPEDLFCCEFAPYFMEGVKIRYPEYCRELPPAKKQAEPAR